MNKKRNLKVELLRIISILLVIANHSILNIYYGDSHKYLSMEAFTLMGVTIFFIITGFYLYNNKNTITKVYKNYWLRIFIPFSIFCILVIMFEKAINCDISFIENMKDLHPILAIKTYLQGIKRWTCTNWTYLLGHTWYVFDYSVIIVLFPLTHYIVNKLNKRFVYILCILFLIGIIYIDFTVPKGLGIYALSQKIPKAMFISLCGHVFYNDILPFLRNKIKAVRLNASRGEAVRAHSSNRDTYEHHLSIICLVLVSVFIVIFNIVVRIQQYYDDIPKDSQHFPYYFRQESFLMLIMSFVFITILFILYELIKNRITNSIDENKKDKISNVILFFSKKTFLVYLIHSELIVISMNTGIFHYFANHNAVLQVLLNIVYVMIIYICSILIVSLLEFIKNLVKAKFTSLKYGGE